MRFVSGHKKQATSYKAACDCHNSKCDKSEFIRFSLLNLSIYQLNTAVQTQIMLAFPCFCPYVVKQGKVFYSPTTLSSSRAEVRLASLEA